MEKYLDIITSCPMFSGIEKKDLNEVLDLLGAKTLTFRKNQNILNEGDSADFIGVVLRGSAEISRTDYNGNQSIISRIESGKIFAESFALAQIKEIPVSVTSAEDSEILFLKSEKIFDSEYRNNPLISTIIFNLLKISVRKNLEFNRRIEVTSKRTTREKLMTFLLLESKRHNSLNFKIAFNRQELSDYLEVDRSGLSAVISELRKEKIIKCRKNEFTILKMQ